MDGSNLPALTRPRTSAPVTRRNGQDSFLGSVSAYYYTPAQAVFVGALIGLGVRGALCPGLLRNTSTEIANGLNCFGMLLLCHAAARPAGPWTAVRTIGRPPVLSVRSSRFQPLSLRWPAMTDNTTNKGGADAGSGSALIAFDSPDEQADLPEEFTVPG
jgi:hypothetical protein